MRLINRKFCGLLTANISPKFYAEFTSCSPYSILKYVLLQG